MTKIRKNIKFYIIATEPSGDVIGARLINSLKKIDKKKYEFHGVGGVNMIRAGLKKSLFPINKLSVFGFFEVIPKIYSVYKLLKKTVDDIINVKPNFLITIDSPDFNFRILKRISKKITNIKKFHYVAPTVWAWRRGRAKFLAKHSDKLFTILPFENKFCSKHNLKTSFVGHPIYDLRKISIKKNRIRKKYKINSQYKVLSFLPGSRVSELNNTMPILIKTMEKIKKNTGLKIHVFLYILPQLRKYIGKYKLNFSYSFIDENEKYEAFQNSNVAISASGTVALELSYFNVPTIVIYKLNLLSYLIAKFFVKIKYANIINILEKKEVIPEFLQFKCKPDLILNEFLNLVTNQRYALKQVKAAKKTLLKLKSNNDSPSLNAAKEIIKYCDN